MDGMDERKHPRSKQISGYGLVSRSRWKGHGIVYFLSNCKFSVKFAQFCGFRQDKRLHLPLNLPVGLLSSFPTALVNSCNPITYVAQSLIQNFR